MVCDVHPDRQGLIERYGLFEVSRSVWCCLFRWTMLMCWRCRFCRGCYLPDHRETQPTRWRGLGARVGQRDSRPTIHATSATQSATYRLRNQRRRVRSRVHKQRFDSTPCLAIARRGGSGGCEEMAAESACAWCDAIDGHARLECGCGCGWGGWSEYWSCWIASLSPSIVASPTEERDLRPKGAKVGSAQI